MFETTGQLVYRLIGDDQLDDRQRVEHRDGSDVPGGGEGFPHSQSHSDTFTTHLTPGMSHHISQTALIVCYGTKVRISSAGLDSESFLTRSRFGISC